MEKSSPLQNKNNYEMAIFPIKFNYWFMKKRKTIYKEISLYDTHLKKKTIYKKVTKINKNLMI